MIDVPINVKILTNILSKIVNFISLVCAFKTHNLCGVISGSDNDCQCSYITKTSDLGLEKQCDCDTNKTKRGVVLDPFGGSATNCR